MRFKLSKFEIGIVCASAAAFIFAAFIYPKMPEIMPSHWNIKGEVDGYSTRMVGVFLMPFISLFMAVLFILIPRIDPLKENVKAFRRHFDHFIALIFLFLFTIYAFTIFWSIGIRIDINILMPILVGSLIFYSGILIEHAKRNWFIGIRTPWTLSSEKVWEKTHDLGAKLYKAAGIISFFGLLFRDFAFYFVIISVILVSVYIISYSYFECQRLEAKGP